MCVTGTVKAELTQALAARVTASEDLLRLRVERERETATGKLEGVGVLEYRPDPSFPEFLLETLASSY